MLKTLAPPKIANQYFHTIPVRQPVITPFFHPLNHAGEDGKNNGFTCSDPGISN